MEFVTSPRTEPYGRLAVFLDIAATSGISSGRRERPAHLILRGDRRRIGPRAMLRRQTGVVRLVQASQKACQGRVAATRRKSTLLMETPGAAQPATGGTDWRACASDSKRTIENPCPSSGSSQYPATKPGAARTVGRMSFVSTAAAAGAWSGSIVKVTSAACTFSPFAGFYFQRVERIWSGRVGRQIVSSPICLRCTASGHPAACSAGARRVPREGWPHRTLVTDSPAPRSCADRSPRAWSEVYVQSGPCGTRASVVPTHFECWPHRTGSRLVQPRLTRGPW